MRLARLMLRPFSLLLPLPAPGGPRSCCSAAISHCVRKTRPRRQPHEQRGVPSEGVVDDGVIVEGAKNAVVQVGLAIPAATVVADALSPVRLPEVADAGLPVQVSPDPNGDFHLLIHRLLRVHKRLQLDEIGLRNTVRTPELVNIRSF